MLPFLFRFFLLFRLLRPLLRVLALPLLFIAAVVGWRQLRRQEADLQDQVVLITGSSRGLGLALARAFLQEGARLVICARDEQELEQARRDLEQRGAQLLALVCDVSKPDDVQHLVREATRRFGRIDILVNNAGVIQVGGLSTMSVEDFQQAMDIMFWGVLYPTLAVLPQMRKRQAGRIVNITSIGGKVSVPHLLPYTSAKFAAVGFSEGLRAELAAEGITVTTIVPGLMRTGGYLNAFFKGERHARDFAWFAVGDSLPLLSMAAARAAHQIVQATKRGDVERTLTLPALLLARSHGLFPGLVTAGSTLVGRLLHTQGDGARKEPVRGMDVQARMKPWQKWLLERLTALNLRAAHDLNQFAAKPAPQSQHTYPYERSIVDGTS